ncbi:hypothetical protein MD484_g774, partial [Candolleomyces efflorescens]
MNTLSILRLFLAFTLSFLLRDSLARPFVVHDIELNEDLMMASPALVVPVAPAASLTGGRAVKSTVSVDESSARPTPASQASFSTDRPPLKVRDFRDWLQNHTDDYRDQMLFYSGYTTLANNHERTPIWKFLKAFQNRFPLKSIFSLVEDWKGIPFPEEWSPEPDWVEASVAMADFSRGKVFAFFGREVEPDSFWYRDEFPALKGNAEVTEIERYILNEDGRTFEGPIVIWPEKPEPQT